MYTRDVFKKTVEDKKKVFRLTVKSKLFIK